MGTINDRIKRIVNELFNGNTSSFARQINVPQPTLKDIVGGKLSTPRADVLEKIFGDKSLNISAEWLLGGEGEMIKNISESDSQNDIQLPEVPEANKSETETIKSLLSVISDQANILKQVTNSKEQKHIEEQNAISIPSDYKAKIRKLDIEVLRKFYQRPGIGRDFFFLSFFLCGMNMKDIFYLPYFENYIDISRLKTARTAREVRLKLKLQPEILEIIKKYADPNKIRMIKTKYKNHKQLTHFIDDRIKSDIEEMNRNIKNEKDKIPHFSFTYARHSWATIAGQLRIPDSTIDKGLMHSVTGLMIEKYREYDYTQVDEANRKVIDYVLYKKTGE